MTYFPHKWMWSAAFDALAKAVRPHREFFRSATSISEQPVWEPTVDVLETDRAVPVNLALPRVAPNRAEAVIDDGCLIVVGLRVLPCELQTAIIHRLELPQGRFERRVPLPAGRYSAVRRAMNNGCLVITLEKAGTYRG